jgi:hypothetical protein
MSSRKCPDCAYRQTNSGNHGQVQPHPLEAVVGTPESSVTTAENQRIDEISRLILGFRVDRREQHTARGIGECKVTGPPNGLDCDHNAKDRAHHQSSETKQSYDRQRHQGEAQT